MIVDGFFKEKVEAAGIRVVSLARPALPSTAVCS